MHYVYTDHLGSLNVITNQSGAIEQELSFDAWGNRRNPDTWTNLTSTPANLITRRGFTGHEHIDEFGIINMNGRLYDPVLGRFLSPDPIIGDPGNTQSYNRYSYVVNNPLMFTDPSGYRTVPAFQYHSYLDDLGRKGGDGWGGFFWTSGSPHVSDVLGLNSSGSMGYKYLDGYGYMDVATGKAADYQTAQAWAINRATQNGEFVNRISGDEYRSFVSPKVQPSLINSIINYANAVKSNVDGLQISFGTKDMVICLSVQNDMYNISFTYSAFDNVSSNGSPAGQGDPTDPNTYGSDAWERMTNLNFWGNYLLGRTKKKDPNVIKVGMEDNPISLLIPFSTIPKAAAGSRVVFQASKNSLITSSFFKDLGIRGMYGTRIWTPYGYATSWQTLIGRWTGIVADPLLIYDRVTTAKN